MKVTRLSIVNTETHSATLAGLVLIFFIRSDGLIRLIIFSFSDTKYFALKALERAHLLPPDNPHVRTIDKRIKPRSTTSRRGGSTTGHHCSSPVSGSS